MTSTPDSEDSHSHPPSPVRHTSRKRSREVEDPAYSGAAKSKGRDGGAPSASPQRGLARAGGGGRRLRVAVLYNLKENAPRLNGQRPKDALAELDSKRNVEDYAAAIRALGHDVVALEGGADLAQRLAGHPVDICFNTCEGYRGDSREAQVPALLEMLGVPYTASKVLALAVTLDKAMTKRVLAYHGLPTPRFQEFRDARQPLDPALLDRLKAGRPLFVKPNREGSGIGVYGDSLVRTEAELRERVAHHLAVYQQTVLVEEYVEGRDVTCGLVGNPVRAVAKHPGPPSLSLCSGDLRGRDGLHPAKRGRADDLHLFPISEVDHSAYAPGTEDFYSYHLKVDLADDYHYRCPAPLPDHVAAEVRRLTVETFRACGCLDVARVDFRLDARHNLQPMILEINALPGLAWNSDLTLCAEAEGWTHPQLLQAVFNAAVDRYGLKPQGTRLKAQARPARKPSSLCLEP